MELFLDHLSNEEKLLVKVGNKLPRRLFSGFIDLLKFKDNAYQIFYCDNNPLSVSVRKRRFQNYNERNLSLVFDIEEEESKEFLKFARKEEDGILPDIPFQRKIKSTKEDFYINLDLAFIFDCPFKYFLITNSKKYPIGYLYLLNWKKREKRFFEKMIEEMRKKDFFNFIDENVGVEGRDYFKYEFKRDYLSFFDVLIKNKNVRDLLLIYKNFPEDESLLTEKIRNSFIKEILRLLEKS